MSCLACLRVLARAGEILGANPSIAVELAGHADPP
jgi:hypothetical protein